METFYICSGRRTLVATHPGQTNLETQQKDPELVPVNEDTRLSGIGRSTLYPLLGRQIAAVRHGRRTLVRVASLKAYLATLPPYIPALAAG